MWRSNATKKRHYVLVAFDSSPVCGRTRKWMKMAVKEIANVIQTAFWALYHVNCLCHNLFEPFLGFPRTDYCQMPRRTHWFFEIAIIKHSGYRSHQEELYQVTPEELKENRRLLQIQGDDSYLSTTAFLDRALKKAQVRAFISGQRSTNRN